MIYYIIYYYIILWGRKTQRSSAPVGDKKNELTSSCMNYLQTDSGGPKPRGDRGGGQGGHRGPPQGPQRGSSDGEPKGAHGTKVPAAVPKTLAATPP